MDMMWNFDGGAGWLWMGSMMLLFWGGVILLVVWAIREFSGSKHPGDPTMATLRMRLAAGEISPEDFEKTRKVL